MIDTSSIACKTSSIVAFSRFKSGGKKSGAVNPVGAGMGGSASVLTDFGDQVTKIYTHIDRELGKLRQGSQASMLDALRVDGTPLSALANVTLSKDRVLMVTVFDKDNVGAVRSAIEKSAFRLKPVVQDTLLRVPLPAASGEATTALLKEVKTIIEDGKTRLRRARHSALGVLKKEEKAIGKDAIKRLEKDLEKSNSGALKQLQTIQQRKEKELRA
jgi:ribosome recycling factor